MSPHPSLERHGNEKGGSDKENIKEKEASVSLLKFSQLLNNILILTNFIIFADSFIIPYLTG
jgi:hypothetical protein